MMMRSPVKNLEIASIPKLSENLEKIDSVNSSLIELSFYYRINVAKVITKQNISTSTSNCTTKISGGSVTTAILKQNLETQFQVMFSDISRNQTGDTCAHNVQNHLR